MSERRRILVQGIVQGVGFRPFVYGEALRRGLGGFVLNHSAGVTIEVEGRPEALDSFVESIRVQPPTLARIDGLTTEALLPRGEAVFIIAHSLPGAERSTLIAPDSAICDDCMRELFDPADRRYRYPFINCTSCGPRFTIVRDLPYDRDKTTMETFPLCAACRAEYEDPLDRRFHAQPNACPECGPVAEFELWVGDRPDQRPPSTIQHPIEQAAVALAAGHILAVKGLGGYHLVCDALSGEAVARLRARKRREAKPFALMVPDLATAELLCELDEAEAALLGSRRRPIVLLRRRPDTGVAPMVAPGHSTLGLMLPYTPLHHLLLHDFAAAAPGRPAALVMTSGNLSDEPIAYEDEEARARLAPIADGALLHNRPIHMRCDDSVTRIVASGEQLIRRSRGHAPEPLPLPFACPVPLLATGGHQKNTFCLGKGRQAFLSHHIGDLENLETLASFREGIAHFQRLFDITPAAVAYDLHPDYLATGYAQELGLPAIGVQHHHAHVASVLAEHGLSGPVIGVAADGTGYGEDGAVWGCEVMVADLREYTRLAHLAYVPLPGGEQAVRQPWRMAAAHLAATYGEGFLELGIPFVRGLERGRWGVLAQMIARGLNCPPTSSLGRLFDGAAALIGLRGAVAYEGQAAIELEQIAAAGEMPYPAAYDGAWPGRLEAAPLIQAMVEDILLGATAPQIAGRFHASVAELLALACEGARVESGLQRVALSGGVFQNRLLTERLVARLERAGFLVYLNRRVPPNDGGLSLGQLAVAAARIAERGA